MTLAIGLAMGAASFVAPKFGLPLIPRFAALGVVLLVGGVYGANAFAAFSKAKTTINPVDINAASSLVTTGIYSRSRNPMYVGLTSVLLALSLVLGNVWLLIGPALFVAFITRFQIIPEERAMLAKFGEPYAAYCQRVRRWL
jgi:protein-S-isoprenylcysteine O-methyltransferase Ste14